MTFTEMIKKLEELRSIYGDIKFNIRTDEGEVVSDHDLDVHLEKESNEFTLSFYY